MNNFLRGGRGLPIAYSLWPKAFIIIFCVLFSCLTVLPVIGQEAVGLNEVRPLKVGDQIPDELWDMPLKVVNHPEGKEYIRLSDYRDKKLIILDFWGTWCSSCILEFPISRDLQDQFNQEIIFIPLSNQKSEIVEAFVKQNDVAKDVKLWSVVEDRVFDRAIIKYSVPHFVWVAEGKIISNTTGTALKAAHIKKYLKNGDIAWGEKVNLNKDKPFLTSVGDLGSSNSAFYYEGDLDGAGKARGNMPYTGGRTNYYFTNHSQREIYEWFIFRLGQESKTPKEMTYSSCFKESDDWDRYNNVPISFQIIADNTQSLAVIFDQFRAMCSLQLDKDESGNYAVAGSGKENAK